MFTLTTALPVSVFVGVVTYGCQHCEQALQLKLTEAMKFLSREQERKEYCIAVQNLKTTQKFHFKTQRRIRVYILLVVKHECHEYAVPYKFFRNSLGSTTVRSTSTKAL